MPPFFQPSFSGLRPSRGEGPDFTGKGPGRRKDRESPYPVWIVQIVGVDFLHNVTYVLANKEFSNQDLYLLSRVPTIKFLEVRNTQITSDGLKHLSRLNDLQATMLEGTEIDDDGLKYLACHTKLAWLFLDSTNVTDDGLVCLKDLTGSLDSLRLSNTHITDAGVEHLKQFKKLKVLDVNGTDISPAGMKELTTALSGTVVIP